MKNRFLTVALVLSLSIFSSGSVLAEDQPESMQIGNLYGTVVDDQGTPLPGATLILTGGVYPQAQVTDSQGRFRFVNLRPGDYAIKAEMEGFAALEDSNIVIRIGRNTTIEMTMSPAVEDIFTVEAESPLLDVRRDSTGTVTAAELAEIPTARDPWALLQSTPGVLVDRINVGGSESGSCGSRELLAPGGTSVGEGFAKIDEMIATRMAVAGSLPSEFDFNAFTELPVQTLDADSSLETSGPQSSLRPKRGTNEWRAMGFFNGGNAGLSEHHSVEQPGGSLEGDRLGSLRAGSAWLGGPLREDRLWVWGEAGFHELERFVLGGQREEETGHSGRLKVNAQIREPASVLLAASRGDSEASGRGAGPDRAPETTWDEDGREDVWAAEGTVILSSDLFVTASLGAVKWSLDDLPRVAGAEARIGPDGVARGSWFELQEEQQTRQARFEANVFPTTGPVSHEILLAGGWREEDEDRSLALPSSLVVAGRTLGLAEGFALAELWRTGEAEARTETAGLWAEDKLSWDRWTAVVGLHADRQHLGIADGRQAWTLLPRLAIYRRLGENQTTHLSASLGRYASRLGPRAAWHLDADGPAVLRSLFADRDGDLVLDADEPAVVLHGEGLDPLRPGVDPDAVDLRLRPEITDEAILGVEHAFAPEFTMGLRASWRRTRYLLEERLLVRDDATGEIFAATAGEWIPAGRLTGILPDGTPYDAAVWDLRQGLAWTGGTLLVNGDRQREDLGLSLTWRKRLYNRWMSQGYLTWHDGNQRLGPAFRRFDDPTNALGGGDDEGLPVTEIASGSPHELPRYLATRWSFHAVGFVMLREAGPNLAIAVNGRQGYPLPYYRQVARERAGIAYVQLTGRPDALRTDDVLTVDAQLEKEFGFRDLGLTLSLEATNLLNENTVRERELDLGTGRGSFANETLASRTLRLKVRMSWR